MDLDGARNAKAEIFRNILGVPGTAPARTPSWPSLGRGVIARFGRGVLGGSLMGLQTSISPFVIDDDDRPAPLPLPSIHLAVGIRRSRHRQASQIVLIGDDPDQRNHPSVEEAIHLARGEAQFVYGGKPEFFSAWNPPRRRPPLLGLSVSHVTGGAGTLGAFVTASDGTLCILSNNHVLAKLNQAPFGDPIIQPGTTDNGTAPDDIIAQLVNFVPIDMAGGINYVDCAIAKVGADIPPTVQFMSAGGTPLAVKGLATQELFIDDPVWKVGRTSGLTNGKVFAVEVDNYILNVGTPTKPVTVRFDNQIQIDASDRSFSLPGDSGSLVLDHDDLAQGLLFAGTTTGGPSGFGLTTINPLAAVLEKLDAKLWIG